jgi:hypothetical protein
MKTTGEIIRRINQLKQMIVSSQYQGHSPESLTAEYETLCWVIDVPIEDLQKIKNDYILATLGGK